MEPEPSKSVPPKPVHRLEDALRQMRWGIEPGRFALVGFDAPPVPEDLAALAGSGPAQCIREGGETTLLLQLEGLEGVLARHPGAAVERGLVWLRFECPMAWDLVGFLARVSGELARVGVPLGAVCGYSRDHLFVAEEHLEKARRTLEELFGPAALG